MTKNLGFTEDMVEKQKSPFPIDNCTPNVVLTNIEYELGTYGPQVRIEFTKTDAVSESTLLHWKAIPTEGTVREVAGKTKEEVLEKRSKSFNTYMKHILNAVGSTEEEIQNISGDSIEELITNTCNLIKSNAAGKSFYIKTLRKKKTDYAQLPPYPPFMQDMEAGSCTLKYSEKELQDIQKGSPSNSVNETDDASFTL